MARKVFSAQAPVTLLVPRLAGGSDPSMGRNPVKLSSTYTFQHVHEVPSRGEEIVLPAGPSSGLATRMGLLNGDNAPSEGTIQVLSSDFSRKATLLLGKYEITSLEDYGAGDAVQATGLATVVAHPSTATLTIGGVPLADAGGARTPGGNDYDGTLGTEALIAAEIAAAINDPDNGFVTIATAIAVGAAVNLTAVPEGTAGNAVTLSTSDAGDITVGGASFSGGVAATVDTAALLAARINALPGYSASSVGDTVSLTGPSGPEGNFIQFKALYQGAVQNFDLTPSDGVLGSASPVIGPPILG